MIIFIVKRLAVILMIVYSIIGLGMSSIESISKIGSVSAILGFLCVIFSNKKLPSFISQYILVVFIISLSWLWAPDATFQPLLSYWTPVFGAILMANLIYLRWISVDFAFLILCLPFFINLYAYVVGDNFINTDLMFSENAAELRFGGYLGHPNSLVTRLILPIVFFALYKDYFLSLRRKIIFGFIASAAIIFGVLVTGSKKAILIPLPLVLLTFFHIYSIVKNKSGYFRFFIPFFSAVVLLVLFFVGDDSSGGENIEVFRRINDALEGDASTYERWSFVLMGLNLFPESPLIGYGLDAFRYVTGTGFYSHNNFIELAVNVGILGLIPYIFVVYGAVFRIGLSVGYLLMLSMLYVMLSLDFTGVSYSDRGTQIVVMVFLLVEYFSRRLSREKKGTAVY